jgi:hypothetical protein
VNKNNTFKEEIKMQLGESDLTCEDIGKVVLSFDVSNKNEDNDEDVNSTKLINSKEAEENTGDIISKNFKEYIEICNEMELIPSWIGFENYTHMKKREAQS